MEHNTFVYTTDSSARILLKREVKGDWKDWTIRARMQPAMAALRFGLDEVVRGYNFYTYTKRFEGFPEITRTDLEALCKSRYPDATVEDVQEFVGIMNYTNLYKALLFWDKAPITINQLFDMCGIQEVKSLRRFKDYTDELRIKRLPEALNYICPNGRLRELGYLSPYMFSVELVDWRKTA